MILAQTIFWLMVFLLFYTYIGYPLLVYILAKLFPKPVNKQDFLPTVTVIIAAYNEELAIADKIRNVLVHDYPKEKLDVIVVSDASSDTTDEIVKSYPDTRVKLLRVEGRKGKTAAQNEAVKMSTGSILVFTDATTYIAEDAIRQMVRNFADPDIGVVGGDLTYLGKDKGAVGEGGESYWSYEKKLKANEAMVNSLIGVSGCFYGVRKEAYSDISPHLISDFVVALDAVERGYRVVYEPAAKCSEETLHDPRKEFSMRVRVALRSYSAIWEKRNLLNIFKYRFYAIQLISHKVLRYATFILLFGVFISNLALYDKPFYNMIFVLQILFYLCILIGIVARSLDRDIGLLAKPYYFMLVHYAAAVAFIQFLRGEKQITWETVR